MKDFASEIDLIVVIPLVLQLLGLALVVLLDPYIGKKQRRLLLLNAALIASLIAENIVSDWFVVHGDVPPWRTLFAVYAYAVRPLALLLICCIAAPNRKHTPFWILLGANALLNATALFSHICFWIEDNRYHRGPLGYSCHIVSAIILLYLLYLTFTAQPKRDRFQLIVPIINVALVVAGALMDTFIAHTQSGITFLSVAMVSSALFYYIWLHLKFVHDHEKALEAESRIRIMMSQIQPHFLYNTLSSIQALCRIDPEKAFDVTEKFGTYLRSNIDSLDRPDLIPFTKELEHTRVYSEIEMIRFPNVRVDYDVTDAGFSVPALTVQPLVENAIRYGVRIRKEGIVTVSSKRAGNCHEIVISDNGKGFDTSLLKTADGTHIGVRNVRERIEKMCGGTLTVESAVGEGTTVTIRIPLT
ncbi:MAG: histidine kinase [Clostridia bacterium]|nr:histidine kinase [Clostridia bacterium]